MFNTGLINMKRRRCMEGLRFDDFLRVSVILLRKPTFIKNVHRRRTYAIKILKSSVILVCTNAIWLNLVFYRVVQHVQWLINQRFHRRTARLKPAVSSSSLSKTSTITFKPRKYFKLLFRRLQKCSLSEKTIKEGKCPKLR